MELLFTLILLLCALFAMGQNTPPEKAKRTRPVKVSLLSNYYEQEGTHSAVNGGTGSQQLGSFTQEGFIYIPFKDSSGLKVSGGVDHYTSASLLDIDKYQTSASTGTSNVSNDETRGYANISVDLANKVKKTIHTPSFGFSKEYDVLSFNGAYGFSKFFPKKNITYNTSLGIIADRWLLIYPGEFRGATSNNGGNGYGSGYVDTGTGASGSGGYGSGTGSGTTNPGGTSGSGSGGTGSGGSGSGGGSESGSGIIYGGENGHELYTQKSGSYGEESPYGSGSNYGNSYATPIALSGKTITKDGKVYSLDMRYSLAFSNAINLVVNKKMNAAVGLDLVGQWGMLSTPFHRVYFNDGITDEIQKEVRIEKLPSYRIKGALYGRLNIWVNRYVNIRTHARYYYDTWNIHSIALTAEMPIKPLPWLAIVPFYRFYWQSESKYFKSYGEHIYAPGRFYTSDYDLSGFISHKAGGAIRVAPMNNLVSVRNENNTKQLFALTTIGARYAYYHRSDGLSAHIVSLEIDFEF